MRALTPRRVFVSCALVLFIAGASCTRHRSDPAGLVPTPAQAKLENGFFVISSNTSIAAADPLRQTADYLALRLRTATGYPLASSPQRRLTGPAIRLELAGPNLSNPEAYSLRVTPESASVTANTAAGAFYGVQTLLQLMPPAIYGGASGEPQAGWTIRSASIRDAPRFAWRGFMLDVARHFFQPAELEALADALALHKLNRFHLHLTDDHGWRLEIKRYPRLTEVGGWREKIGFRLDPKSSTAYGPDGRYGGYYTQEEARAFVQYAAARHILVVPEIEMPGHASAALAAYPELSCFGGPYSTDMDAGVYDGVFCAGKEETFQFLTNVLTEVMEIFPGRYIHAGGDEVPKDNWEKCPRCQERIRKEGLKDEGELQDWFMERIATFLNQHGRTMVGWSEIAEGRLPPNTVVMDWVGGGLEAARLGHDVVMTPTRFTYLDYYQSTNRAGEPRTSGGFVSLEKAYSFEPIPARLERGFHHHILGLQGNLWTEYIPSLSHAEYMAFPRLAALAEVGWSPKRDRDYASFLARLKVHFRRLEEMGINYRPLQP